MKVFYKLSLLLSAGVISMHPLHTAAQYCAPTVNTSGLYLSYIAFDVPNVGFTGTHYNTGSNGYTQTVGSSSGSTHRYFGGGMYYGIYNNVIGSVPYDFATYVDWNNDGDFNDANEVSYPISGSVPGQSSSTTGYNITPPLSVPTGNYRVRVIVSQSSGGTTPAACGTFTGEAEDYLISILPNVAPVLKPSAVPVLNNLLSTQTSSDGFSVNELIGSAEPTDTLINDADDMSANFGSKVPRGIAIYGQNAANGNWQYKIGNGAWTNFGTLSTTNALLLMADAGNTAYQPGARLRFVPTGVGTPSISFKAWDATTGTNGGYAAVTTTGGTTAFSNANQTSSLSVIANSGYTNNVYFVSANNTIYSAPMNKATKSIANPEPLLSGTGSYTGLDLDIDPVSNKIFWISAGQDSIFASSTTGSGTPAVMASGLTYSTGLAVGNGKLYYSAFNSDYSAFQIYKVNTDGTNSSMIYSSSAITDSKDIEFYNGKLYFQYGDASGNYHIGSIDTAGAGLTSLYTAPASTYFQGMNVAADTMYWSETNATIKKKAIAGGSDVTILTTPNRMVLDMVVDPITSTIYFTDNDINSNDRYTNIRRIATTGGAATTINTVTNTVYSLAFNNGTTPLPIELLDFGGTYIASTTSALLNWETASEQNNTQFILERSTDAKQFAAIATIKGNGTTSKTSSYKYNDNLAAVTGNVFYYRLQQVDINGQTSYSKVVAVNRTTPVSNISVWPNPSNGNFNIHLNTAPSKTATALVYSGDGRLVKSINLDAQDLSIDLSNQPAGTYMLQLNLGDNNPKQITLVKQ